MIFQKQKDIKVMPWVGLWYKIFNRKDEFGIHIKVLRCISHAIVKKWDIEVQSFYASHSILTYYPKKEEVGEMCRITAIDHSRDAEIHGYTIHYDIPLEDRHITNEKPF